MNRRKLTVGGIGGALAVVALTASAGVAAATGHPISGTCYESGSWFTSSNVRTMGSTYIKASFNVVPSKGLAFRTINYNTGAQLGSTIYSPPTSTQTIASGKQVGTQFVNSFRLQVSGHQDNYSFDGSETY